MTWGYLWDVTKPAGGDTVKQGDDEIRNFKQVMQERLATLTNFPNSAGTSIILLANTVNTTQLVDGSVTLAKVAAGVVSATLTATPVVTAQIANASVTAPKLAPGVIPALQVVIIGSETWLAANATYDGVNWNRSDITKGATALQLYGNTAAGTDPLLKVLHVAAGANPITWLAHKITLQDNGTLVASSGSPYLT